MAAKQGIFWCTAGSCGGSGYSGYIGVVCRYYVGSGVGSLHRTIRIGSKGHCAGGLGWLDADCVRVWLVLGETASHLDSLVRVSKR